MNKSKREIVYSIAVLIIVPALLAINTIILATSVRKDYDKELQSRAELANSSLSIAIRSDAEQQNTEEIQNKIADVQFSQKELRNVTYVYRDNNSYSAVTADGDESEFSRSDVTQYDIVYSRNRAVAKNLSARTDEGQRTRAWNVASPIVDDSGAVIGILASDMLTTDLDEKFDATLMRSIIIMILSALAVLALLINHFKFIGYANNLRKQKELNQTMGDFLSVATHELKAPMSIIKGYIANVVDGDYGKVAPKIVEQLNVASAQTDRLNELVQDLLNVSRVEQGRINYDIKPVNIGQVIELIVKNYQPEATKKDLKINYEPMDNLFVEADAGRTQEIFTNLIDNAVKYSEKGEIVISHEVDGGSVITAVRDTGVGMTSDERKRLFQRFYRVKNEKTKNISGTGLGLWIIKQYIEKMGGKIEVDSLANSGSEFRVMLKKSKYQK